jgi:hypothetical protein
MTAALKTIADPASLFLDYYARARSWSGSQRATAPAPDLAFDDLAREFLKEDDAEIAAGRLADLVEGKSFAAATSRGRIIAAMRAIDDMFYQIHPRSLVGVVGPLVPRWLRDARLARFTNGEYGRAGPDRLIARGPLLRNARHLNASSGDLLSDYFAALAIAPLKLVHDGRNISLSMTVIDHNPFNGVPISATPGSETVGFLPLATVAGDIEAVDRMRAGRMFAAYGPASHFDAAAVAIEGLRALGGVDIAIMPELAMTEAHADKLATALIHERGPIARLIVTGTYSTSAVSPDGQPWNETRVLNSQGVELWRQRKLWAAGVGQMAAKRYGLSDPGPDALVLEDNAAGDDLVIADIDGLGRCVVLICQDCETPILGPMLLTHYQPDWVFTPIFDCTIDPGRWAHARAFSLSPLSQARFLAVTNMAFAGGGANMGLAVGPKEAAGHVADELDRAFALVTNPAPATPIVGKLQWRSGLWHQSWLEIRPATLLGGP